MKKLIIIPAYNESENIVKTVESIREKAPGFDYIIVNGLFPGTPPEKSVNPEGIRF